MADQFSALGVHFNNTGLLFESTGAGDGMSTNADGWCPTGGYNCFPNNILIENSPSGGQSLDTLRITFDVPQSAVQMDVDNGYLCESNAANVELRSGGTLASTLTLTQANEIAACKSSQSAFQLCGRFQLNAGTGQTFTEIDLLPTTCSGVTAAVQPERNRHQLRGVPRRQPEIPHPRLHLRRIPVSVRCCSLADQESQPSNPAQGTAI
jgi:hypothetical protein